jgi:hypothetical protein
MGDKQTVKFVLLKKIQKVQKTKYKFKMFPKQI